MMRCAFDASHTNSRPLRCSARAKRSVVAIALCSAIACSNNSPPPIITGTVVVSSAGSGLRMVGLDAKNLYWITYGYPVQTINDLYATPIAGGTNLALGQTSIAANVGALGLDATTVYFPLNDTIVAAPIAGGTSRVVATGSTTTSLAVASGVIYWIDDKAVGRSVPVAGGSPTILALPSADVPGQSASSMIVSNDAIYASFPNGTLRISLDTTPTAWLNVGQASGFYVDTTNIYFAAVNASSSANNDSNVLSVPKASGQFTTLTSGQYLNGGLTVDEKFVYFDEASSGSGRVLKVPKAGGGVSTVANYAGSPGNLLADDAYIYWDDSSGGTIERIAK